MAHPNLPKLCLCFFSQLTAGWFNLVYDIDVKFARKSIKSEVLQENLKQQTPRFIFQYIMF